MWLDWGDDGFRHSVLGFGWVWWLVGVYCECGFGVVVGVGVGPLGYGFGAFWCESVGGIVGSVGHW